MFAFHFSQKDKEQGGIDWIGEIKAAKGDMIRLQVIDAFAATVMGCWDLSSEIKDVPKSECRIFLDKSECLTTALRINNQIHGLK